MSSKHLHSFYFTIVEKTKWLTHLFRSLFILDQSTLCTSWHLSSCCSCPGSDAAPAKLHLCFHKNILMMTRFWLCFPQFSSFPHWLQSFIVYSHRSDLCCHQAYEPPQEKSSMTRHFVEPVSFTRRWRQRGTNTDLIVSGDTQWPSVWSPRRRDWKRKVHKGVPCSKKWMSANTEVFSRTELKHPDMSQEEDGEACGYYTQTWPVIYWRGRFSQHVRRVF